MMAALGEKNSKNFRSNSGKPRHPNPYEGRDARILRIPAPATERETICGITANVGDRAGIEPATTAAKDLGSTD